MVADILQFSGPRILSISETAGGTIFIGTDKGLFKSTNSGKSWKHVYAGSWTGHMAESNGVLVSTSKLKQSSKQGGFHPLLLTEPYVNLSIHTALQDVWAISKPGIHSNGQTGWAASCTMY